MPAVHMQPCSWQFGGLQARLNSAQTEYKILQPSTGPGRNLRVWRVAKAQCAAVSLAGVEPAPPASLRCPTPAQPGTRNSADLASGGVEQTLLKNLTWTQLQAWCAARGERPQRASQLWRWMYHSDHGWPCSMEDTAAMQNGLSAQFRGAMRGVATFSGGLELQEVHTAPDGTRKLLSSLLGDGSGSLVETVMIPIVRGQGGRPRLTICVSSEIGCAQRCQFCYTGRMGLKKDLSAAQIVEQVILAKRLLAADVSATTPAELQRAGAQITNIVFMGMGEPLANLQAVLDAVDIICHPLGLQLSARKVTVSTVGLVPEMQEFMARSRAQLAVSLHATTDEVRDWLCPINRRWNLASLLGCLQQAYPRDLVTRAAATRKFVLIEYVMLHRINDTVEDAYRLVHLLRAIDCKVNLIVFNTHEGSRFQPSTTEAVLSFRSKLIQDGRVCTVRDSRGDDEMAACGQLGVVDEGKLIPLLKPPPHLEAVLLAAA